MTSQIAVHLIRFAIQLLLLPLLILVVPMLFAAAWMREAIGDWARRREPQHS
ncbi:MAG TPA: hypothetical protein VHX52_13305 [Steroidobacteraceae bacterium]|jgi:hypothetical protein|nr:hypothetical protein [Steroidobacteraceae bacterium]